MSGVLRPWLWAQNPGRRCGAVKVCRVFMLCCLWMAGMVNGVSAQSHQAPAQLALSEGPRVEVLSGALLRIAQAGTVRMGYRADAVPFSFVPEGWRRPVGYSIDICRAIVDAISQRLGQPLTMQWLPVTATDRFDLVIRGEVDMECGMSSDTPQRREQVAFSPPIYLTGARWLVPRDVTLRDVDDLRGKRLGVVADTTAHQALTDWLTARQSKAHPVTFATYDQGFDALTAEKIDALLGDEVLLYALLARRNARSDYRLSGPRFTHEVYGIALARDDAPMQALVRATLADMAATRELEHIYARWFQRRLPHGKNLRLPMSPALRSTLEVLAREARRD